MNVEKHCHLNLSYTKVELFQCWCVGTQHCCICGSGRGKIVADCKAGRQYLLVIVMKLVASLVAWTKVNCCGKLLSASRMGL